MRLLGRSLKGMSAACRTVGAVGVQALDHMNFKILWAVTWAGWSSALSQQAVDSGIVAKPQQSSHHQQVIMCTISL